MDEKTFLTVDEVAELLSVSKSKAYEIVRQLNKELKAKGFITVAARVSRAYFDERMCYSRVLFVNLPAPVFFFFEQIKRRYRIN